MSFVSDSSNSNNKDIDLLNEETSKTSNQEHDELKTEKKKKRIIRKKNRYQELLEDTFLFHIGEKKKSNNFPQLNEEVRKMLNKKRSTSENDKIIKTESNVIKKTSIIFHGENYEKTSSPANFMKYNFDFVATEQYNTEHLIVDKDKQHVDFEKLKDLPQKEMFILKKDLVNLFKFIYEKWPKDLIEFNYKITFNIIQQFNFEKEAIQLFINNKEKFELYLKKIIELNKSNLI